MLPAGRIAALVNREALVIWLAEAACDWLRLDVFPLSMASIGRRFRLARAPGGVKCQLLPVNLGGRHKMAIDAWP